MPTPKKGVAYSFTRVLFDMANPGKLKVTPTIAAGDFKVSIDNGALTNLTNLPVVTPSGSVLVLFTLTSGEMNGDRIDIVGIDQAGNEWGDIHIELPTTVQTMDDVPTALQNADALLNRDLGAGTDSGSSTVRTVRQALRFLRNKWAVVAGTLSVYKEDDATASWTAAVTGTPGADPVSQVDPAGP